MVSAIRAMVSKAAIPLQWKNRFYWLAIRSTIERMGQWFSSWCSYEKSMQCNCTTNLSGARYCSYAAVDLGHASAALYA